MENSEMFNKKEKTELLARLNRISKTFFDRKDFYNAGKINAVIDIVTEMPEEPEHCSTCGAVKKEGERQKTNGLKCPTCNAAVEVEGNVTQHYVPLCDIPNCRKRALKTSIFCGDHERAGKK